MSPKLIIIADDLTGALDCAAAFAARGLSVIAARAPENFNAALAMGADVIAMSTGTRERDPETAKAILTKIREILRPHTSIIFKKIDSRMKGHILAETEILAELKPGSIVVSPAIPRLGRFVKDGTIVGAGVQAPITIASFFGPLLVDITDAQSEADLDAAITSAKDSQLFVGAAGLAAALARRLAPLPLATTSPSLSCPALLAIGSRDPVTIAQVEVLKKAGLFLTIVNAPNGVLAERGGSPKGISVIQMIPGDTEIETASATTTFARGIAAHTSATRPKTLFSSGGESANAILEHLGIGLLHIHGEVLPGVPCATARDGVPGLTIITKSGGFGDPQTLVALCNALLKS